MLSLFWGGPLVYFVRCYFGGEGGIRRVCRDPAASLLLAQSEGSQGKSFTLSNPADGSHIHTPCVLRLGRVESTDLYYEAPPARLTVSGLLGS